MRFMQTLLSFIGLGNDKDLSKEENRKLEEEKKAIYEEIEKTVDFILELQEKVRLVDDLKDRPPIELIKLEFAERYFFVLYNELRTLYDQPPLKGNKFTNEYRYGYVAVH